MSTTFERDGPPLLDRVKKKGADCNGLHGRHGAAHAGSELKSKSHSMEALETPTPSLKSFEFPPDNGNGGGGPEHLSQQQKAEPQQPAAQVGGHAKRIGVGLRQGGHKAKKGVTGGNDGQQWPVVPSTVLLQEQNGCHQDDGVLGRNSMLTKSRRLNLVAI